MRRASRAFAGLTLLLVAVAVLRPVEARVQADLQVLESIGVGAAVGIVTRIPAESPGGAVYAGTTITLDKALARAAGAYPGYLVDAFFRTSMPGYTNPSEAVAQHPEGAHPSEATAGTDGDGDEGRFGSFRARAGATPDAAADAEAARVAPPSSSLTVDAGTASSRSHVEPDGTVVTEVRSTATGIQIGDAVRIAAARTSATVRTPPAGTPVIESDTEVTGVLVGGLRATLGQRGLELADKATVSPAEVAAFEEALAALEASGLAIEPAPVVTRTQPGSGAVATAALLVRITDDGSDFSEELLLAQAVATATAIPAVGPATTGIDLGDVTAPMATTSAAPPSQDSAPRPSVEPTTAETADGGSAEVAPPAARTEDEFFGLPASASARLAASFEGFYGGVVAVALLAALATAVVARRRAV